MNSRPALLLLLLLATTAAVVFALKHHVARMEREIASGRARIAELRWALEGLEARYAYLARPQRLARLAARLGMKPAAAHRLVSLERIGTYRQLELAVRPVDLPLPSGGRVPVRIKPPLTLAPEVLR